MHLFRNQLSRRVQIAGGDQVPEPVLDVSVAGEPLSGAVVNLGLPTLGQDRSQP